MGGEGVCVRHPPPRPQAASLPGAPHLTAASSARLAGALRWLGGQGDSVASQPSPASPPTALLDVRLLGALLTSLGRIDAWVASAPGGWYGGAGGGGWATHPAEAHAEEAVATASVVAQLRWRVRCHLAARHEAQQRARGAVAAAANPYGPSASPYPYPHTTGGSSGSSSSSSNGGVTEEAAAAVPSDAVAAAVEAAVAQQAPAPSTYAHAPPAAPPTLVALAAALEALGAPVTKRDLAAAVSATGCGDYSAATAQTQAQQQLLALHPEHGVFVNVRRFAAVLAGLAPASVDASTSASGWSLQGSTSVSATPASAAPRTALPNPQPPLSAAEASLRASLRACPRFLGHLDMRAALADPPAPALAASPLGGSSGDSVVSLEALLDRLLWTCGVRVEPGSATAAAIGHACAATAAPAPSSSAPLINILHLPAHLPPVAPAPASSSSVGAGGSGVSVTAFLARFLWLADEEAAALLARLRAAGVGASACLY